ncbi:4Fe-4S binding protein [Selenihalanaerobacter shriftii]|uniref:4Fe-4S binding domain-containing protein n=1 Tax=Selenihalanaerobacter shriftii TaxID=142842 RepID=A0A1T4Q810_9FIRM|nr:4Fe-4S binding protein [Selenihalanaerobacter shriftii]SJZ99854.1 4Fe-4S binding domain-containing protein [Selenihalanaerobacter shriftii]
MNSKAYIDLEICQECTECLAKKFCPKDAIIIKNHTPFINDYCNGCGKCKSNCPYKAISLS